MSKEALTPIEQRIVVFYEDELTAVSPAETTLLQVEQMGLAIASMAREHIAFDRRLLTTETRVDKA